jgi:S-DNA-T family DNA segregation ATPase FtsK/SpoIIIE
VPLNSPGQGLTSDGRHFISALPRLDGVAETSGLEDALRKAVGGIRDGWQGPPVPRVRTLSALVRPDDLPPPPETAIRLGIEDDTFEPAFLDLVATDHLLIHGDAESGKTAALRLVIDGIRTAYPPERARIMVVDYRRGLLDAVPETHSLPYSASPAALASQLNDLRPALEERLPSPDVSPERLVRRSWWQGPDLFIVIDDFELLAMSQSGTDPLAPLIRLIPSARDIGLHLVIARQIAGAGVHQSSPLVQALTATRRVSGLILSGDPAEGPLIGGVRPMRLPPGRAQYLTPGAPPRLIQLAYPGA